MGFGEGGSLTKTKAIRIHRAARRALEAQGTGFIVDDETWESYLARAANVGSRTQAHNFNWRLQKLGLLKRHSGSVEVLVADYEGINLEE